MRRGTNIVYEIGEKYDLVVLSNEWQKQYSVRGCVHDITIVCVNREERKEMCKLPVPCNKPYIYVCIYATHEKKRNVNTHYIYIDTICVTHWTRINIHERNTLTIIYLNNRCRLF